ncbi:RANBP2-like and GRIP domain-containing protein 2 isoform X1 [Stylophora pistillata]|uniref:RANBP2-like and GRIP domain-containing protein 2 isoform X1 n=1 Tax=Stylophora pistillata TaxID=50429 RepID=UPI000C04AB78|nr:RANBP2-like and GRIP domain-containing protein 2 isoform X1 [Stylophora pistillata]
MVWTKDQVDKYVAQMQRHCANASERSNKGFAFAKLYKEVSDYENAMRHLEAYIGENETDFRGHYLMGQLCEGMGELERAVASYRRSLELNNSQKELVLKVVKLYCNVPVHPERAKAWADRGARLFPGHPDVFSLRLHLLESAEVGDYEALEDLISEELSKRPREVDLHVRLVRLYAVRGRLDEAFSHCATVLKTKAFQDSLPWVACSVEMFEKYLASLEKHILEDEAVGTGNSILDVHAYLLIALCQFLELNLRECSTREVINVLFRLDHCLFMAYGRKIRQSPRRSISGGPTEWEVILSEMKAQLYMYCGTFLIRLAKEKFVTWPRGLRLACACYLASVSILQPETKTPWVARAPKNKDPLKWYIMACSRLSQTGHFLMATRDKLGQDWLDTCHTDCCSRQGQHDILSALYRDERDLSKSFLACDEDYCDTEMTIPDVDQLVGWDEVAVGENPRSLENMTWIGLHWYQYNKEMRPGVGIMVKDIFPELRLDVPSIEKHIAPNMLCLRDLEAFVYAVVRTSAARVLEDKDIFYEDYEPQILPQPLCDTLSLPVQQEWWTCAYNLYTGKFSVKDSNKTCHTVQCGMEKIRAVDERHGQEVQLLIYLANAFGSKATYLKGSVPNPWFYEEHWKSLEKWSLHFFRQAAKILEMLEKNESIPYCGNPLFLHVFDELEEDDLKTQCQSVRLAIGGGLLKEGKIFEAMELFEQVKTPPGLYNLAQGYKYLAHVEQCAATEESEAESTLPSQEYYQNLRKARELLQSYLKMANSSDIGRKAVMDELTEIESLMKTGVLQSKPASGQRLDSHQSSSYPGSRRSSTNASEVQESDDNFWLDQPHDASTKDLIAKLSEVTLNNGYLQEQMAIRDEAMNSMSEQIQLLQKQLNIIQASSYGYLSFPDATSLYPSPRDQSKPLFESTPAGTKHMSATKSGKPLTSPRIKGPLKIDSSFFAGLSASNNPEKRVEQAEELVTSPVSPGRSRHDSSTSYTEDVHFEPLIPLPERVEVQTGEEDEEVMFSSRAKLYRYDKDVSAWKERGIGILKILYNSEKGRSRILMRREAIHKICANHFITNDMKLTEKKGTTNAWIWNTFADNSEEIEKQEQLAVRFKTQDEFLLFKKKFEYCQNLPKKDTSNVHKTAQSTNKKTSALMGKFAAKPGSWSCSVCLISNEEHTSVCIACGAAKLSGVNAAVSRPEASKSGFQFSSGATPSSSPPLGLQGKPSSEGPSLVTNVDAGTTFAVVNSGLETSDGSSISSSFSFSIGKDANKIIHTSSTGSQVDFGKSGVQTLNTASSSLPISFSLRENGTRIEKTSSSSSPFVFGTSSDGTTHNKASESEEGAVPIQVCGVSSTLPAGTKPPMTQPFVLAPFGVPANADKSNSPAFTFGSSGMAGASFPSLSTTEKAAFENTLLSTETSVFGGTPQLADPGVPFGSFNTGKSPSFDPDLSASDKQADPQLGEKNEGDSQVPLNVLEHALQGQTYPPFSFSTPTTNLGISEQKLFWQQPTGTFQFGQLQSLPPLGGANLWHRGTGPLSDPAKSQLKGTPQTPEMFPQPFTHSQMQGAFTLSSRPDMDFSSSELLRRLAAAKEQQELVTPDSPAGGYDFTPYVVDEPGEEFSLHGTTVPTSFVAEEYDHNHDDDDVKYIDDTEDSDDETISYSATDDEEDELDKSPSRMPAMQPSQVQVQFQSGKGNVVTTPVKPVPIHSVPSENIGPATLPSHVTGRRFLTAKSPLKATKKQDEDCVLVYEVRATIGDREKACRLCLPVNFFNYTKHSPCSGCYGYGISKEPMISKNENEAKGTEPRSKDGDLRPKLSIPTSHVFGESSAVGQLTFSSLKPKEDDAFSMTQERESFKPFQGAGKELFAETSEDVEGQDDDKLHFEPIIALPDEIHVVTGEEGLDVLFCERGKLYRFDSDSSQWKERGLGEMKLLQHPKSGQGRVLMRREQIKKLCANHYISAGMELKPNVGSDRSWMWFTPADYTEGEAKPERLAIRFKSEEIAGKFKEVFDDLKETLPLETSPAKEAAGNEQGTGCALYKQFLSRFAPAPGSWICEVCDVDNNAEHLQCIACNFGKTATEPQGTMSKAKEENLKSSGPVSNAGVLQSEAANTAQDVIKEPSQASFTIQSPGGLALASSKLFTIGRGDPNEEKEDEIYLSPRKTSSPSKQGSILLQKPATTPEKSNLPSSLPFGGTTPVKFTFSLTVLPGSPSRKPKSPSSPTTPSSPESPGRGEDDGPYFEPLIPLPDKVECRTGEEGQEVLFCERCKLFRYDGDTSQWKERGVGDIKILCDSKSNKNRILMRREHVLKLCANHVISTDMILKPFPNSDKAWLWTTLADFSEEEATAETLAARFRTSEVATKFKETFDSAAQLLVSKPEKGLSSSKPENEDDETGDDNHDGPHFEPIIPLPEKIDVKTGEEDDEVIFSHRAKLYRFVAEYKQWKERGVGDIKLLKNRQSGKMRVLMRRDQVLKICANHQITADMKLQPNAGSDRSWVWSTMADFSEGECRAERLAVRFKSEETAKQYKEKFEECLEMLKNPTPVKPHIEPKTIDAKEDLVSKFKPAEGSWECAVCMVNNDSDKVACAACGSIKPGAEPSQGQKKEAKSSFLFGSGASSSGGSFTYGFGVSSQEGDTKPFFTFGSSNQTSSPSSGFSVTFGSSKRGGLESEYQSGEGHQEIIEETADDQAIDSAGDTEKTLLTKEEPLVED